MQTSAELSAPAIEAVRQFIADATGNKALTQEELGNAVYLVVTCCDQCRQSWTVSEWHRNQPVHAFEALNCQWKGANHRYPPLTLNLHFAHKADGTAYIATPDELPLPKNYWVNRVAADAMFVSAGGD